MRITVLGRIAPEPSLSFSALYKETSLQEESSSFFGKYMDPASTRQAPRYYASTSTGFLGRATFAASRIFITRNDSGENTPNAPYFLRVLSSVALSTAYRPYWARSTSGTFKSFGSAIGNGVGINLFHEFGPGIRQMVKSHAPKFVSRITP